MIMQNYAEAEMPDHFNGIDMFADELLEITAQSVIIGGAAALATYFSTLHLLGSVAVGSLSSMLAWNFLSWNGMNEKQQDSVRENKANNPSKLFQPVITQLRDEHKGSLQLKMY